MRAYIEKLKESGALIEFEHSVSSRYEAASIGLKYKDKPVLFHAVDGIHRVIMNAVCSREMLADLLGTTPYNIAPFLAGLPESGEGGEVGRGAWIRTEVLSSISIIYVIRNISDYVCTIYKFLR